MSFTLLADPTGVSRPAPAAEDLATGSKRRRCSCLTKKGKRCKGKLKRKGFTKKNANGTSGSSSREKALPGRQQDRGDHHEPGFKTQFKTLTMRANKEPSIKTRCSMPP